MPTKVPRAKVILKISGQVNRVKIRPCFKFRLLLFVRFYNDKPIREETPGWTVKVTDTTLLITIHEALAEFCGVYTVKVMKKLYLFVIG